MTSLKNLLAVLLLLNVVFVGITRAQDDQEDAGTPGDAADDDFGGEQDADRVTGILARAIFPDQDLLQTPVFPAGEKITAVVALSNDAKNPPYTVFFVNGFVSRLGDHFNAIQNFSGTRHEAVVNGGETATFKYTFQPDKLLEPQDYNLVLRLFFSTDANKTFVAVGYNSSITISDPLGTDPKTIATFFTIAGLIGGAGYLYNLRRKKTFKPRARPAAEVAGTKDNTYDPAYISPEHLKFREQLLKAKTPSPKKR